MVLRVDDFEVGGRHNVASPDFSLPVYLQAKPAGTVHERTQPDPLHVQEEFTDLFTHVLDGRVFMQNAFNPYPRDSRALQRTEQRATKRITQRNGPPSFEWFRYETPVDLAELLNLYRQVRSLDLRRNKLLRRRDAVHPLQHPDYLLE